MARSRRFCGADSHSLWRMLFDCVRVGTRLLKELSGLAGVRFSDHRRRAKRRAVALRTSRKGRRQKDLYRDLLKAAGLTFGYIEEALASVPPGPRTSLLLGQLRALAQKMARVIDQARRRVMEGETVPAREKLFSIFEDHADIIKTGQRDPVFGHKIFLSAGRTSLILDCCIKRGNPADSTLFKPMLERLEALYGRMPDQVSFDGGFASRPNLRWAKKDAGITDVAFAKKRGLKVPEMVRSSWIYQQLKRFRAGIEGCISMLKRVFGADRCTWKGWRCFKRYTQLSVLSYNLLVLARLRL